MELPRRERKEELVSQETPPNAFAAPLPKHHHSFISCFSPSADSLLWFSAGPELCSRKECEIFTVQIKLLLVMW